MSEHMVKGRFVGGLTALVFMGACGGGDRTKEAGVGRRQLCESGECVITFEHIAAISDSADPGMLFDRLTVRRDGRGILYTIAASRDKIAVFESTGRFVRYVGRRGSGPGEFRLASYLTIGPGDSLYVFDASHERISVFSPQWNLVREYTSPYPPAFFLESDITVVPMQVGTAERIGFPLHTMGSNGQLLNSFGAEVPQYRSDMQLLLTREAAPSRDGLVWAVAPGRYVIEQWDPRSGKRLAEVKVDAPWFVESGRIQTDERARPLPLVQGIWEDEDGFLWTLVRTSDADWHPPVQANVHRAIRAAERNATYDWLLNVVDPRTGKIIATQRLSRAHDTRSPSPYLASYRESDTTHVTHDVWRPTLTPKEDR
jgi:hypothetical protein